MFNGWKKKVAGTVSLKLRDQKTDETRVWNLNPVGTWTTQFSKNITVTKRIPDSVL